MSLTKKDRIIRSVSGITFPPGGFATAIAAALRREYGATHAAVKTVVALTGANERAVKNWIEAKNATSGDCVVSLCSHSVEDIETLLMMAGREYHLKEKRTVDKSTRFLELLAMLDDL